MGRQRAGSGGGRIRGLASVATSIALLATSVAHAAPKRAPSVSSEAPAAATEVAPPPSYPPPPGYPPPAYPPPAYAAPIPYAIPVPYAPRQLPYEDGQPVPAGYRVEERVRRGPTIAGALLLGIPYVIGLTIASAFDYSNKSGWLAVPAAGPWLTLFLHKKPTCPPNDYCFDDAEDSALRVYLVIDGILQATGTVLLTFGLSGRRLLVRDDVAFTVTPMPVGAHGYGPALIGRF